MMSIKKHKTLKIATLAFFAFIIALLAYGVGNALNYAETNDSNNEIEQSNSDATGNDYPIRKTDVETAGEDCYLLYAAGEFTTMGKDDALELINSYRKEACEAGNILDPRDTSRCLTAEDYVPIKWSSDLEWVAQTRAAECSVYMDHIRPNGKGCFTLKHNDVSWNAECLSFQGWGSMRVGIESWYGEKNDWIGQTGKTTGHYTSMIDPRNKYVGVGNFTPDETAQSCTAASFYSYNDTLDESSNPDIGNFNQVIEAKASYATLKYAGNFKTDLLRTQQIVASVECQNSVYKLNKLTYPIASDKTWSSSDETIATIDNDGVYSGKKGGNAIMTFNSDALTGTQDVTIDASGQNVLGVELSDQEFWLKVGQSKQLVTSIYPTTALNKNVEWSTSGYSGYVEVIDGLVTAKQITYDKHYDFTVTAKTVDGGYTAVCKGHLVTEPEVSLESSNGPSGLKGNQSTFTATTQYGSGNYQYQFLVNDQIKQDYSDSNTFDFTPSSADINIVKCNVKDTKTADVGQCEFKYYSTDQYVPVTAIKFEKSDIKCREGYYSEEVKVNVEPENATTQQLQWTSSDEDLIKVVSVSSDYKTAKIEMRDSGAGYVKCSKDTDIFDTVNVDVYPEIGDYITSSAGSAAPVNTTTKFKAYSDSSKHYQYKFFINSKVVRDYADDNEYSFTPTTAGKYSVTLIRKDMIDQTTDAYYFTYYAFSGTNRVTGVSLGEHSIQLTKGGTQTLSPTVQPTNASFADVVWDSSNSSVARVENGTITASAKGTAKITVKTLDGGYTDECEVNVIDPFTSSITSSAGWQFALGTQTTFTTTCTGGSGNYKYQYSVDGIKYGSESTTNTLLFDRGLAGRHVVSCSITDNSTQATASAENTLVIYDGTYVPTTGFSFDDNAIYVAPYTSVPLSYQVVPEDASNKHVSFSFDKAHVASVYNDNEIYGSGYGTTTLTGVTEDGSHTDTVTVHCTDNFGASVESSLGSTIPQGSKTKISSCASGGSENYNYKFTVDGAVVQEFGTKNYYEFSSTEMGRHSVICETKDVDQDIVVSSEIVLTVIEQIIPVTGVTLDKTNLDLAINQSYTLSANVKPENATNKNVTWSSSDPTVATVENGKVFAKKQGTANVVVTTEDGGFTATCQVVVYGDISVSVSSQKGTKCFVDIENIFSANATGGSGNFEYQFCVDGTVVQEYSTNKDYVLTPTSAKSFLVTCNVKDTKTSTTKSADFTYTAVAKPAPQVVSTTTNSASLQWSLISGVDKYAVATKNADGSFKTYTKDLTTNSYTITGLNESTAYKCLVQACIGDTWNTFDDSDLVTATTSGTRPVVNVDDEGDGYADVSWDAIPGATEYAIAEMENGTYRNYTTTWKATNYHCDNLANGYEHYILVQAFVNGAWSKFDKSNYCSVFPTGPTKPTTTVVSTTDHSVKLSWEKVAGSTSYAAAVRDNSGKFRTKFVDANTTSTEIDGLTDSTNYDCLVQCQIYGAWSSFTEDDFKPAMTKGNRPVPREVATGDGYADIKWDAIPGATAYAIATIENGSYKNYSTTCTDTTYHCDNLANGYSHYILVQAFVDGNWSPFTKDNYLLVDINGPTKKPTTTVSGTTDSSVTITWNQVPGASEYAAAVRYKDGKYKSVYLQVKEGQPYPLTATIAGLNDNTDYKAIVQSKIFGEWSIFTESEMASAKTANYRPQPTQTGIGDGYADISWPTIPAATKYAIAEMENGSYRNYTTEWTGTTYHCDNLANGYDHYILVQAFVNGKWTNFDKSNYLTVHPTGAIKPAPTVESTTSSSITLTWAKVAGAQQYAAAVRLDDGSYKTVIVNKDTTTATIDGLQPGKTYKCLVQCQIYGAWSSFTEADLIPATTKTLF